MTASRNCRDCGGDLFAVGNDPNACTCEAPSETTAIFVEDSVREDDSGDEYRVWHVFGTDDDGEPTGDPKPIKCLSRSAAFDIACSLAEEMGVEVAE